MNNKEIVSINTFNDFYYKSCFYNAFFSIVNYFDKDILPILSNDVLIYHKEDNEENMEIKYLEIQQFINVINSVGIGVKLKFKCEDVISDIKSALCRNRFVILWIDCYYESNRKEMYLKNKKKK